MFIGLFCDLVQLFDQKELQKLLFEIQKACVGILATGEDPLGYEM